MSALEKTFSKLGKFKRSDDSVFVVVGLWTHENLALLGNVWQTLTDALIHAMPRKKIQFLFGWISLISATIKYNL